MSHRYEVVPRRQIGRHDWDKFVDETAGAWLWHLYDFQDALATWPCCEDVSVSIVDNNANAQIVAIIPLHIKRKRVLGLVPTFILDSLGGVAIQSPLGKKAGREILNVTREFLLNFRPTGICLGIRLAMSPMTPIFLGENGPRVNPLLDLGCENTQGQTWVVDLRGGRDAVWEGMEGRARTSIRKAERAGVTVRVAMSNDLDLYYDLHVETYRRTGITPHPRSYFDAIWRYFIDLGLARVWIAELDGKAIAAENFATYKNAAMYWTGAANQTGLETGANSLLQWTSMQWMIEQGVNWYETGEAFPQLSLGKYKGLNDFKRSFGGEMHPYYRAILPIGTFAERMYKVGKIICNSSPIN